MKKLLGKIAFFRYLYKKYKHIVDYFDYIKDYHLLKQDEKSKKERFSFLWQNKNPRLGEKTTTFSFDSHYIYHTGWAARVLASKKPKIHIDISSSLYFSVLTSAFIPVEFYDYRPAELNLSQLTSKHADLLSLPFEDNSLDSLSCMHVLEHIGLGRYGDPIDYDGDLKAINELKRVTKVGGLLIIVVPIGKPKIEFNAHRIYSYEQIIELFNNFKLENFALVGDNGSFTPEANQELSDQQNFGCGCFVFTKES